MRGERGADAPFGRSGETLGRDRNKATSLLSSPKCVKACRLGSRECARELRESRKNTRVLTSLIACRQDRSPI